MEDKTENEKADLSWLMNKYEACSNRYIEAEEFMLEIAEMNFIQRAFCVGKILRFLKSRSKYNF